MRRIAAELIGRLRSGVIEASLLAAVNTDVSRKISFSGAMLERFYRIDSLPLAMVALWNLRAVNPDRRLSPGAVRSMFFAGWYSEQGHFTGNGTFQPE